MALQSIVDKAELYWQTMPEFGESAKPTQKTQGNDMAIDPTTLAMINAGSNVLGQALGGGTSSSASSPQYTNFNNSGMTVATSGSKANGGSSIPWWGWVVAGLVVIKVFRRKA